jgi:pyruvate dehydrogenase E2 component (dihydrolipoamide acetyltransferase)
MEVRLPNLGEGVDSGSVVTIFVKEGDVIAKGQTILELENEKAVAPIPSPGDGRVAAVRVKPGDKVSVGQILLSLAPSDGQAKPAAETRKEPEPKAQPTAKSAPPSPPTESEEPEAPLRLGEKAGVPPPASPSLRKLARDLGIDLSRVHGTQAGGRIVLADLRSYVTRLQDVAFRKKKEQPAHPTPEPVDFSKWGPVKTKPASTLRQVISRRMVESWTTIPQVTQFDDADVTGVNELRKKHAAAYEAQGARLTLTSFVLKAVTAVLKKHPVLNASLDETGQNIVFKEYYHIGLAVDTEAGLVVPVLRDVDTKSMVQVSKDVQELADKARERKLSLEEMKGSTFTISNQGGIGGGYFTPIINKPEAAILGLGRSVLRPVVKDGQIVPRLLLPLGLSYDHRLIDGANAARFMVDLVAALENFRDEDVKL